MTRCLSTVLLVALSGLGCATTSSPSQRAGGNYEPRARHLVTGIPVFNMTTAPAAWNSNTGGETSKYARVPGLHGEACQYGIGAPVPLGLLDITDGHAIIVLSASAGNGGFSEALQEIKKAHPEVIALADVRADMSTLAILSVFYKSCVHVHGTGLKVAVMSTGGGASPQAISIPQEAPSSVAPAEAGIADSASQALPPSTAP
ncbi:MAG: hypothetical protein IPJ88_10505 [Myxococcales bacterium]|nr:MAG: hypothetical protein IPJ88_10505 [Myxococcales bacterium]